jgi:hypothetical protein
VFCTINILNEFRFFQWVGNEGFLVGYIFISINRVNIYLISGLGSIGKQQGEINALNKKNVGIDFSRRSVHK